MTIKIYYYLWSKQVDENGNRKILYQGKEALTEIDIEQIIVDKWEDGELPCPMHIPEDSVTIQVDIDEVTI